MNPHDIRDVEYVEAQCLYTNLQQYKALFNEITHYKTGGQDYEGPLILE